MPFVNQRTLAKKWQFLLCSRPCFLASSGISKWNRQLSTAHIVHTWSKYHLSWQITYDTFVREKREKIRRKKVKLQGRSESVWLGGTVASRWQQPERQSQIWIIQNTYESTHHPLWLGFSKARDEQWAEPCQQWGQSWSPAPGSTGCPCRRAWQPLLWGIVRDLHLH